MYLDHYKKPTTVPGSHEIFGQTLYIAKHLRCIQNTVSDLKSRLTNGAQMTEYNHVLSLASQISIICLSFDRQHTRLGTWQQSEERQHQQEGHRQHSTQRGGKKRERETESKERKKGREERRKLKIDI